MKLHLIVVITLLLSGCASNPYAKFYQDRTGNADLKKSPRVVLPTGNPTVYSGGDLDADYIRLLEDGYGLVGIATFRASGEVKKDDAISQAKKVHASVVLLYSKYIDTVSGSYLWETPDTQRSTTSLSGNVMGPGGTIRYSGREDTTTQGTKTTTIPYSYDRNDYFASFWIKLKPPLLGTSTRDLSDDLKQKIGSNKGVVVFAIVKGSPAFRADILKGDVIKRVGDVEILDRKTYNNALSQYAGKKVAVKFLRGGKEFTKEIVLNENN